jgi:hypothetical protein
MRRSVSFAVIAGLVAIAGLARANGVGDYPRASDAGVQVGEHEFRIFLHGARNTVLFEPDLGDMNRAALYWDDDQWRVAAKTFLQPFGCAVARVVRISRAGPAWEATYYCPLGTDLPSLVREQSATPTAEPSKP